MNTDIEYKKIFASGNYFAFRKLAKKTNSREAIKMIKKMNIYFCALFVGLASILCV